MLLPLLRWANESVTFFGAGLCGFTSVLVQRSPRNLIKYVGLSTIGAGLFVSIIRQKTKRAVSPKSVVFITGCDSGLGYNLALQCDKLNMFVCAACLNVNSDGALKLREKCDPKRFLLMELDLRKTASILHAERTILTLLSNDLSLEFTTLINNAGVMCFGEFEWQTTSIADNQININLVGTLQLTKMFLPLIRKYRTRIINVTSHCALEALPGLSVYGATKAGLRFWNDALRVEMKKYGVHVVNFIPGSLVMATNITARQDEFSKEMRQAFTNEQLDFYGQYYDEFTGYLELFTGNRPIDRICNDDLFRHFEDALLDKYPNAVYKCEPRRYQVYHLLFKYMPTSIRDRLVERFINFPRYQSKAAVKRK